MTNVVISDMCRNQCFDYTAKAKTVGLNDLIASVAASNPLWTFTTHNWQTSDYRKEIIVTRFRVTHDGVDLGTISYGYNRGKDGFCISNERISKKMERNNEMFTSDTKKALQTIKKMFSKPDAQEHLNASINKADAILMNAYRVKQRKIANNDHTINAKMIEFAEGVGAVQFALHLTQRNDKTTIALMQDNDVLKTEMLTVEGVKDAFDHDKVSMVIVVDKNYVVKTGDNVQLYDDNTLPEHIRGKLGLLKLVEDEQVVTGIGCRVSVNAFVVVLDEPHS
jgi:hypothetical protein